MLRTFIKTIAVFLSLIAAQPAHAATSDIVRNAVNGYILAGYERLSGEAHLEVARLAALCATPGATALESARAQFRALVLAWSWIEPVRFGPVLEDNRLERILFWPDRKSTGLKQVQAAIAIRDQSVTDVERLRHKSVALQGIGALEYALHGTGAGELATADGAFRCAFAKAIAEAVAITAEDIAAAWLDPQGIAHRMQNPKPEWADYRSETEVLAELLGIWVHGIELIRDTRLTPFLGKTPADSNAKAALFWRSNLTLPAIRANAAGLRDLFIVSGLSDALSPGMRWAGGAFAFEFENFNRTAGEVEQPVADAIADPAARGKINYLLILTRSLQNIAVGQIAAELGVNAGFSTLDGD